MPAKRLIGMAACTSPRWSLGAALLLAAPVPVAAQSAQPACVPTPHGQAAEIRPGTCVRSAIDAGDQKDENSVPYEDWRLHLEAGEAVLIDLDSIPRPAATAGPAAPGQAAPADVLDPYGFDTYLELRQPGFDDPVVTNDDRPGSLNSRISFTAPASADYIVRARPLSVDEGEYELRVIPAPPPPPAHELTAGANSVPIGPDSPASQSQSGYRTALFSFDGNAGDRIRLVVTAPAPGIVMTLTEESGRTIRSLSEEQSQATLIAILTSGGHFRLQVEVPDPAAAATLTVGFERVADVPAQAPHLIRIGETTEGVLGLQSNVGLDPYGSGAVLSFNELFLLPVTAGETATVTLESRAFDPVLDAGAMSALGFAVASSNDDGGDGLNSRLVLRPVRTGMLLLRVRALGNGVGPFRLTVRPGEVAPAQEAAQPRQ